MSTTEIQSFDKNEEVKEEGVDIPWEKISKDALSGLIEEFVLREGTDYGSIEYSLDEKKEHVMSQLKRKKIKVVYDQLQQTCNLVVVRSLIGFFFMITIFGVEDLRAKDFMTNSTRMHNAPQWLKPYDVQKVTEKMRGKLEWSPRRVNVYWYKSLDKFKKAHGLGSGAIAVTRTIGKKIEVHMGPKVNAKNFSVYFAHELVHVIIRQKYKGAIPNWLEEGFANYFSKAQKVDYKWLSLFEFPKEVKDLAHPFKGNAQFIQYRYKASQALVEMLDKKCDLTNLLRLSVQRKLEDYIKRTCEIKDMNKAFKDWVLTRSKIKSKQ